MGQHAGLRRDFVALPEVIDHHEQCRDCIERIRCRIDADHRIPAAVHEPVEHGRGDALDVVGGMVRLQAHGHASGQPDGIAKARDHRPFLGRENQVLIAHEFRYGGDHFRREPGRDAHERGGIGGVGEQPVAEIAHREMRYLREGLRAMFVDDQPRHLIAFVRDHGFAEERAQRHLRQRHLRGDALFLGGGRDARKLIAGALRRGSGQQGFQVVETIRPMTDGLVVAHRVILDFGAAIQY